MKKIYALLLALILISNVNAQDQEKESSLYKLVFDNKLSEIKKLVEAGEEVDVYNYYTGESPLTIAAGIGNLEIATYLLVNGADPDGVSDKPDAHRPLTTAVQQGHLEVVKLLLFYGADENIGYKKTIVVGIDGKRATQEWTPAMVAKSLNLGEIADFLEKKELKSSHSVRKLINRGEIAKARDAIKDGWGADGHDYRGRTTLMLAAADENYGRIIDLAVENGADPKAKDKEGKTLLHHFAMRRNDRIDGIKQCINEFKLGVNDKDKFGNTPFLLAAWNRGVENIEFLIESGANINDKDGSGNPALVLALKRGKYKNGDEPLDAVEMLIKHKANIELADADNATPIIYAVWKELKECAELLLDKGANVNAVQTNGWSLIHQAVNCGDEDAAVGFLEMILKKKPTTFNAKYDGKTALALAKEKGYNKCVEMLKDAGATE